MPADDETPPAARGRSERSGRPEPSTADGADTAGDATAETGTGCRGRRDELVDAAMALFTEHGYAATRIADICDRAGVAKGLFYWYFPTKLDLFAELVATMRHRLRRAQAAAMDPAADPLTRLRQGTVASVRFMAEHANYFTVVEVQRGSDPAIAASLASGTGVYLDDVATLVREAQDLGTAVAGDPHLLAHGVVGAVASASTAWRSGEIDVEADELAEFVGDWVVRALS